jgi:hypothetical protein
MMEVHRKPTICVIEFPIGAAQEVGYALCRQSYGKSVIEHGRKRVHNARALFYFTRHMKQSFGAF